MAINAVLLNFAVATGEVPYWTAPGTQGTACSVFSGSAWTQDVSMFPVHPNSSNYVSGYGFGILKSLHAAFGTTYNGEPNGFMVETVETDDSTPRVPVNMSGGAVAESDCVLYPLTQRTGIEGCFRNGTVGCEPKFPAGGGDRHVIVVDERTCVLHELFSAVARAAPPPPLAPLNAPPLWSAYGGSTFNMHWHGLTTDQRRPRCWTSADAAGLPIFPGLVQYDEVYGVGAVEHALRVTAKFTVRFPGRTPGYTAHTRSCHVSFSLSFSLSLAPSLVRFKRLTTSLGHSFPQREAFIPPASHYTYSGGKNYTYPAMGLRLRMKADYDCTATVEMRDSIPVQVLCRAMKKYGLIVADNGEAWDLSGTFDERWDDNALHMLVEIKGDAFEAVYTGEAEEGGC